MDLPFMRNFLHSIELANLVKGVDARTQATVQAKDLTFNHCCEWEVVKQLCEVFPDVGVPIFSEALVIEAVPKRCLKLCLTLE